MLMEAIQTQILDIRPLIKLANTITKRTKQINVGIRVLNFAFNMITNRIGKIMLGMRVLIFEVGTINVGISVLNWRVVF